VSLPYAWRRFPYALTAVAAAPRFLPGPFQLVRGSKQLVVVRREGLTVQFRRVAPLAAVRQFRRGKLDEVPIPVGDIRATKADPQLAPAVRARTLLGIDLASIADWSQGLRRVYWETANRKDYAELIPELTGAAAYGFLGGEEGRPADFRRAVDAIPSLRKLPLWFGVPPGQALRSGARRPRDGVGGIFTGLDLRRRDHLKARRQRLVFVAEHDGHNRRRHTPARGQLE
jgi:hypothetical protein